MSEIKEKKFRILEKNDLNYVIGGAKEITDKEVSPSWKEKSHSHKCDCGKFESEITGINLSICDNCKHAKSPENDKNKVYCSVDLI